MVFASVLGRCHICVGIAWRVDFSDLFPSPIGTWPRHGHPQYGRALSRAHWLLCSICLESSLSSCLWWREIAYGSHASTSDTTAGIPITSAMIGTPKKPPARATEDLRIVSGTLVDVRIFPTPLSPKEDFLLLARWRRYCHPHKEFALSTWLQQVNRELGSLFRCRR